MNLKAQTIETYNATAEAMAKKFNNIGARINDIEKGLSYVNAENPYVLEIGCGNGRDALEILKRTNRYLGIDISKSMIELAHQTAPSGEFIVADIETYKFPQDIDIIFSFASLLHSDNDSVEKVLTSAGHALKKGGIFYISLKYGEGQITKTDEFGVRTYFFYTPEDIKKLAGEMYETLWEDEQNVLDQKWFTIVLRKV